MKLHRASMFFDRDSVYDAYTGAYLWKAQFSGFDGSKPDGSFERRRTISVAPGTPNASRRVIKVQESVWLLGEFVQDTFFDKPIRLSGAAKLATDRYQILSPAQVVKGTVVDPVYAQTRYLKSTVDTQTTSGYQPFFDVYFGSTEKVPFGYFLKSNNKLLRVRDSYAELEGFVVAQADEISDTVREASPEKGKVAVSIVGAFDPITETYTNSQTTVGILLDMYMFYDFKTEADRPYEQGDKTLVLDNVVSISAGDIVTIGSDSWQVKTKTPYYDAWNLHIRRA